ncbi:NADH dehydrogenase [ubiquinone] 1 alpha subcomplex subunit 3, partial [Saguinus oedipus]
LTVMEPPISPDFEYSVTIDEATPCNYPVPIGDEPNVPSHPQDPQGPSLEWLKNL